MWRMRGSESETAEEAAEVETSSGAEATAKGKEQTTFASSSDKERTAEESTDNVTEDKGAGLAAKKKSKRREKKERRRAKLFRESTAELVAVRTLEMAMDFNPLPNQEVVLQVPEDVDVREFVTIARYAEHVGYRIHNERHMMLLMLRKFGNMLVSQMEDVEADPPRPQSGAEGTTASSDGGGQGSSESTSYSSTHAAAGSRGKAAKTRRRPSF